MAGTEPSIDEIIKRIQTYHGVEGYVIVNSEGIPIKSSSNFENDLRTKYSALITQLIVLAKSVVREMNKDDDLTVLRMRTKLHEILVTADKEIMFIVIQNTNSEQQV
ncbi:dynein light chain [Acrasis kona]|uniref:Dynein light chain roadblock n=1 Tax=Acrasis kona TaxID=1008807 RepID=A0AAW2YTN9_9EUKA